jgi:prepilin-type N-terminal cleavage/methylation domain-containing protein
VISDRRERGFTLIELAVTVAVALTLSTLAYQSYSRTRPRAALHGVAAELHAFLHSARQSALASGHDVDVLLYPTLDNGSGVGRVVMYGDAAGGFLTCTAPAGLPDLTTFTPNNPSTQSPNEILDTMELPRAVRIAAPVRAVALPFPYDLVAAPVDADAGCPFCGTIGGVRTGAIRFDSRGRATFYGACGAPGVFPNGVALSVTAADAQGSRAVVVMANGTLRTFSVE